MRLSHGANIIRYIRFLRCSNLISKETSLSSIQLNAIGKITIFIKRVAPLDSWTYMQGIKIKK